MSASLLYLTLAIGGTPEPPPPSLVFGPPVWNSAQVITAGRPEYLREPTVRLVNQGQTFAQNGDPFLTAEPPGTVFPPTQDPLATGDPWASATPVDPTAGYDPFLGPPPDQPVGEPIFQQGLYGPKPFRFGWQPRANVEYLPGRGTTGPGAGGDFEIFGVNAEMEYNRPIAPGWIFRYTQEFNYRSFSGPAGGSDVPENAFRFGFNFGLEAPRISGSPFSLSLQFNPSLNTDFANSLSIDAVNWDGRAILYHELSQELTLAYGLGYWDRVRDRILPHAGVIWKPHARWEFRLMYPESRISYFLGHGLFGGATWLYLRGEYHVEAYEIQSAGVREQMELEDYRIAFGMRKEYSAATLFVETGLAFDREVRFGQGTPGFDIDRGFFGRLGISF